VEDVFLVVTAPTWPAATRSAERRRRSGGIFANGCPRPKGLSAIGHTCDGAKRCVLARPDVSGPSGPQVIEGAIIPKRPILVSMALGFDTKTCPTVETRQSAVTAGADQGRLYTGATRFGWCPMRGCIVRGASLVVWGHQDGAIVAQRSLKRWGPAWPSPPNNAFQLIFRLGARRFRRFMTK